MIRRVDNGCREEAGLKLARSDIEGVAVIGPEAPVEIDVSNCDEFRSGVAALLGAGGGRVVVDATNVGFFDSAGVSALLSMQKMIAERQGRMVIAGLNRSVEDVFRMVGFDIVFEIYSDVEQAARSFDEKPGS
jgi:anti-anti-sigma factor